MSEAQLRPASKPGIKLDVRDDEMIVTLPGTSYSVTYYKPANSPQLLAKNLTIKDDRRSEVTLSDFLARAWTLAATSAGSVRSRPRKSKECTGRSCQPPTWPVGGCDDTATGPNPRTNLS
jgi:hypothetical protein